MKSSKKLALMFLGLSIVFLVFGSIAVICGGGNVAAELTPTPTSIATSSTNSSGGISTAIWIGIAVGIILVIEIIILLLLRWIRTRSY
jgi:hypothetical protein